MSTLPDLPSMMQTGIPMEYFDAVAQYATAYAQAAQALERARVIEEAAKVAEPSNMDDPSDWTEYARTRAECAAAIRGMK